MALSLAAADSCVQPLPAASNPPGEHDVRIAGLLAVAGTLLFLASMQTPFWGDGRGLVDRIAEGEWQRHHVFYLPLAHALDSVGGVVGLDVRGSLELFSALMTGFALGLFYLAARWLALPVHAALLGCALLATIPVNWWYATTVEIHALQLAACAGALLWTTRASALGTLGTSALGPAVLLALLTGSHLSGALAAPALALLALFGSGRWAWPRHVVQALLVLALFVLLQVVLSPNELVGDDHTSNAAARLIAPWRWQYFYGEFLRPSGFAFLGAVVVLARFCARAPRKLLRPVPLAALLATLVYIPFASTLQIQERGAYYLIAFSVCALALTWALGRAGRLGFGLGLVLVGLQAARSLEEVRLWRDEYPGHEWARALVAETGGEGLVLTSRRDEFQAIWDHHAPMVAVRPSSRVLTGERSTATLFRAVERQLRAGRTVAVLRTLCGEGGDARFIVLCGVLRERFGEGFPGRHPAYFLLTPE